MTTTVVTCDRCGATIDRGRAVLTMEHGPTPPSWPTDTATGRPTIDLCGACAEDLNAWLRNRPA